MHSQTPIIAVACAMLPMLPAAASVAPSVEFTERAADAGIAVSYATPSYANSNYSGGGTIGDFNRDGWMDLFVCSGGSGNTADYLFINNGDGTFTDEAAAWGITVPHRGKGAAVGDINDDGWPDLYVTSVGPMSGSAAPGHHLLYRNNGNGTFTEIADAAGVDTTHSSQYDGWSACFSDYDLDGDLDLAVGGSRLNNQGSKLFRNNGNETFTDVTGSLGLFDGVPGIWLFVPALVDMDGDRYPDLLAVGDFGTSRYFRNNGGTSFTEMSGTAGAAQEENGMGQTRGDFDNDGRLDWYVTSIYLPSNNWTGNKLYRNDAAHSYTEYAEAAGAQDGGYGWGTVAVDFDHNGWLDIAETNGDSGSGGSFSNEQSYLFMNNAVGGFNETAVAAGLEHYGAGRAMLHFDYDNDGDQDVVIISYNGTLALFNNDLDTSAPGRGWLRVFLDTQGDPTKAPMGIGARVFVTTGATTRMAPVDTADTYLGNNEPSAHFGLGAATIADEVRVDWTDGTSTTLMNVAINQTITISSLAAPCPADLDDGGEVDFADLVTLLSLWGPCVDCAADLDGDELVGFTDLLALLSAWGPC